MVNELLIKKRAPLYQYLEIIKDVIVIARKNVKIFTVEEYEEYLHCLISYKQHREIENFDKLNDTNERNEIEEAQLHLINFTN